MRPMRRTLITAGAAAGAAIALAERTATGRRISRNLARSVTRAAHYESGRLQGLRYRIAGGHPDLAAEDRVLADRVRSSIGSLEHRLDVPRVHVMAVGHDVTLHGDVDRPDQIDAIVRAVRAVPGVDAVDSHLRVGRTPGEARPSDAAGA